MGSQICQSTGVRLGDEFEKLIEEGRYCEYVQAIEVCGLEWLLDFRFPELVCHLKPLENIASKLTFTPRIEFLTLAAKLGLCSRPNRFQVFYEKFKACGDMEAAFASLGLIMLAVWESGRDFRQLIPLIEEAERLMETASVNPQARAFLMFVTGWTEIVGPRGDILKVFSWLDRIYKYAEEADSSSLILMHGVLAGHISFWRGDLAAVEIILDDASPFAADPHASPFARVQFLSTCGLLKTLQGLPNVAQVMLRSLLDDPSMKMVPLSTWLFMHGNYLYTVASLKDRKEIDRVAGMMRQKGIPTRNHYNNSYMHFDLAAAELALGRPHKALLHGMECKKHGERCCSENVARMSALVIGQALADLEMDREAMDHFEKWLPIWKAAGYNFIASLAAVEMAYIHLRNGHIEKAKERVELAHELVPKHERIPCLYRPADFVDRLKMKLGLILPPEICNVNRPIEILCLGNFSVKVNGSPMKKDQWRGRLPQILLKAVVALDEGSGVSIEQLSTILWPDSDGDLAMNTFKVTLWRLRHSVTGNDRSLKNWILVRQKYVLLSENLCFVDAFHFRQLMKKALEENSPVETLEHISAMYRGNFIDDFDDQLWIIKRREQLRTLYIKCIDRIFEYHVEKENYDKAMLVLNKALRFDPLNELLYRRLMECYSALDNNAKALEVYYIAEQILKKELDAIPGPLIRQKAENIKLKIKRDIDKNRRFSK